MSSLLLREAVACARPVVGSRPAWPFDEEQVARTHGVEVGPDPRREVGPCDDCTLHRGTPVSLKSATPVHFAPQKPWTASGTGHFDRDGDGVADGVADR
jgi:hypothetical protein